MERLLPSGIRLGEPLVQSARDPEILRAVQRALEPRDVTMARAAKIFSGRIFDLDRRSDAGRRRSGRTARSDRDRTRGKDASRLHRQRSRTSCARR